MTRIVARVRSGRWVALVSVVAWAWLAQPAAAQQANDPFAVGPSEQPAAVQQTESPFGDSTTAPQSGRAQVARTEATGNDPFGENSSVPAGKAAKPLNDRDLERRIELVLTQPTHMEFIETPLADAVDYLKDLHGIEIQLDTKALEEAGIGTDTPMTGTLKGVSLHSRYACCCGRSIARRRCATKYC